MVSISLFLGLCLFVFDVWGVFELIGSREGEGVAGVIMTAEGVETVYRTVQMVHWLAY